MPADIHHGETVDTETVILSVVTAETVVWDSVAFVTSALLPAAMFRLPAMRPIPLPGDLLHACLFWAPVLCRPVVLLLTLLLPLLILLPSGLLLLLFRRVVLLLTLLLPLLILLPSGLLLLLFRRVVLLLTLLLPLLILLPSGLLLSLSCRLVLLRLFRFCLLLLFCGLILLLLFLLLRVSGKSGPKKQK